MRAHVAAIDIAFVVPALPTATFRESPEIGASILYDIGCYAISLLTDLGLPLEGLVIAGLDRPNSADELLHLAGQSDGLDVVISVGVGPTMKTPSR